MILRFARPVGIAAVMALAMAGHASAVNIPGWPVEDDVPAKPVETQEQVDAKAAQARQQAIQNQINAAWADTGEVTVRGPGTATIAEGVTFAVPEGFIYVPQPYAARILKASMIPYTPDLVGFVVNTTQGWTSMIGLVDTGHITADVGAIDPEAALAAVRAQQKQRDLDRAAHNRPPLTVIGWNQPPVYDPAAHTVQWSLHAHPGDEIETGGNLTRYNGVLLGRESQLHVTSVIPQNQVAGQKATVTTILANLHFAPEKAYAAFDPEHDQRAGFTLAALYGGEPLPATGSDHSLAYVLGLLALGGAGAAAYVMRRRQMSEPAEAPVEA